MTEEEKMKRREWAKRNAVEVTFPADDLRRVLDGTNPVGLFFESRKAYGFYRSFQRYLRDTKEELWERMEKAGLTDYDAEKLLALNGGLRLKGKPFMSDVQEQWIKECICERKAASKRVGKERKLSDEEERAFEKALKARFMRREGDGYKWLYNNGSKASLAYFISKVFNPTMTSQIPYKMLNRLFGVNRLEASLWQALGADKEQRWRKAIDDVLEE